MPRWSQRNRRGTSTSQTSGEPPPGVADAPTFINVSETEPGWANFELESPGAYPDNTVRWDLCIEIGEIVTVLLEDAGFNASWPAGPDEYGSVRGFMRCYNSQGFYTDGTDQYGPPEP